MNHPTLLYRLVLPMIASILLLGCPKDKDKGGTIETPDRGDSVGSRSDIDALRDAFDETDPIEEVSPSVLAASPGSRAMSDLDDLQQDRVAVLNLSLSDTVSTGRAPWNSAVGARLSAQHVQTAYKSNWPQPGSVCALAQSSFGGGPGGMAGETSNCPLPFGELGNVPIRIKYAMPATRFDPNTSDCSPHALPAASSLQSRTLELTQSRPPYSAIRVSTPVRLHVVTR